MSARADYIAGLRQLADLLDHHEELPLPHEGTATGLSFMFYGDDPKSAMAAAVRALPVQLTKNSPDDDYGRTYYQLTGHLHGLKIDLSTHRSAVCERVVVSTETVVVPARPATPERTEVVEQVEWRCHPVLADAEAGAA